METVASIIEQLKEYPPTMIINFWASETEKLFISEISPNNNKTKPALNISMEYE